MRRECRPHQGGISSTSALYHSRNFLDIPPAVVWAMLRAQATEEEKAGMGKERLKDLLGLICECDQLPIISILLSIDPSSLSA
jgi:hypothetical protein